VTPHAGFFRRAAALSYDLLIIVALQMLYTALAIIPTGGNSILRDRVGGWAYLYRAGLVAIAVLYYGFFWRRSGQTVGMRAWRLVLRGGSGSKPTVSQIAIRTVSAPFAWLAAGLGVLWLHVDPERLALQDRCSGTRIELAPKRSKKA
jgi:uncharacterized RDD family membrane protein YckC